MASSLADGDPKEGEGEVGMEFVSPQISSSSFSRHVDSESAYLRNISGSKLSRKPNRRSDCRIKYWFRKTAYYCYSRTSAAVPINPHLEVKYANVLIELGVLPRTPLSEQMVKAITFQKFSVHEPFCKGTGNPHRILHAFDIHNLY